METPPLLLKLEGLKNLGFIEYNIHACKHAVLCCKQALLQNANNFQSSVKRCKDENPQRDFKNLAYMLLLSASDL